MSTKTENNTIIQMVKNKIPKDLVSVWRAGVVGDSVIEATISHEILMILQMRQDHPMSALPKGALACEFDICHVRQAVFESL